MISFLFVLILIVPLLLSVSIVVSSPFTSAAVVDGKDGRPPSAMVVDNCDRNGNDIAEEDNDHPNDSPKGAELVSDACRESSGRGLKSEVGRDNIFSSRQSNYQDYVTSPMSSTGTVAKKPASTNTMPISESRPRSPSRPRETPKSKIDPDDQ